MRVAMFEGFDGVERGVIRLATRRRFSGFGAFSPGDAGRVVSEQVAKLVDIDRGLWAALPSSPSERERWIVESWHTSAEKWWTTDTTAWATQSESNLKGWRDWGVRLAESAKLVADELRASTLSAQAWAFAKGMPGAIQTVLGRTGEIVGSTIGSTTAAAAPGVGKTLLWIGIPLALIVLLGTSGGRKIDLGIVKLG